jgi:hypothetical protein
MVKDAGRWLGGNSLVVAAEPKMAKRIGQRMHLSGEITESHNRGNALTGKDDR